MRALFTRIYKFSVRTLLILGAVLGVHYFVLLWMQIESTLVHLVFSYGFAFVLSVASYAILQYRKDRSSELLGFVFMWRALIKLILYFIVFWFLSANTTVHRIGLFVSIVVPYSITLIIEVAEMSKDLSSKARKK